MQEAECPVCTRIIALTDQGTIRVHGGRPPVTPWCPGSRREATTDMLWPPVTRRARQRVEDTQ
jgi:hypothetical protein